MKIFFAIIAAAALSFVTAFDSAVSKTGELEAQVTIKGLNHDDPSEDYIKVLNDAFVEAFNTVHPKKGYRKTRIDNYSVEIYIYDDLSSL
jgi:hypothetical protein